MTSPDAHLLSVRHAANEVPSRIALVLPERSLTYEELAKYVACAIGEMGAIDGVGAVREVGSPHEIGARGEGAAAGLVTATTPPIALVAVPTLAQLSRLYACFELGVPVLLVHPRATLRERNELLQRCSVTKLFDESHESENGTAVGLETCALLEPPDDESDLAWIPTSGSSGDPKVVRLSRRAFVASARASASNLGWFENDRWLLSLPFAHVGGLSVLTRCLIARRTVVVARPGPDPRALERCLAEHDVTLLSLVPTQLRRFLDAGCAMPPSVRAVLVGGAPMSASLLDEARRRAIPALGTYGMTETCSQIATARLDDVTRHETPASAGLVRPSAAVVGPPLLGIEVRTRSDGGLEVRGDVLLSGYVGREDSPLDTEGWFSTRDRGHLTPNGHVVIEGRQDAVIISGGENVAPESVESVLREHADVDDCCVVGCADPEWGEIVTALVVPRTALVGRESEAELTATLEDWTRARLAAFRVPRRWHFVRELPHLESGKLDRKGARALAKRLDS